MYDNNYTYEFIMRNRSEELNRKLERMAGNNSFPVTSKSRKRMVNWMSMILISIRDIFTK